MPLPFANPFSSPGEFAWFASGVAFLGGQMWFIAALRQRRGTRPAPPIPKDRILYQEWAASGCSDANVVTQWGFARNCLRLIATADALRVTSWFPFSLFAALVDMDHYIPLRRIRSVTPTRRYW